MLCVKYFIKFNKILEAVKFKELNLRADPIRHKYCQFVSISFWQNGDQRESVTEPSHTQMFRILILIEY